MSERRYFVMCENRCLFEAMSKEQTIAAIMQAVNEGTVGDIDAAVSKVKELNKNADLSFWVGTETEYNALGVTGKSILVRIGNDGNVYICTDDSAVEGLHGKVSTEFYKATLSASAWENIPVSDGSQNVYGIMFNAEGVLASDSPFVDVDLNESEGTSELLARVNAFDMVHEFRVTADNQMAAFCYNGKPTVDLPVIIKVVR